MSYTSPNTLDLLRTLPMDDATRRHILSIYPDACTYEVKSEVEDLIWNYYEETLRQIVGEDVEKKLLDGPLPDGYVDEARVRAERTYAEMMATSEETHELDMLRNKIKSIVQK